MSDCSRNWFEQSDFAQSTTSHCFIARKCFSSRPECGNLWYGIRVSFIGLLKLDLRWCYSHSLYRFRDIEINWSSDRIQLLIRHHWAASSAVNKLSCCKKLQLAAWVVNQISINLKFFLHPRHYRFDFDF